MRITQIAAIGSNMELGRGNTLLWDLPDDMAHFMKKTKGKKVIMGRKTYESIGKALPERENIILSRNEELGLPEEVRVVNDIEAYMEELHHEECPELMVIGGGEVYGLMMPYSHRLIITHVHGEFPDADAYYPEISPHEWEEVERSHHEADEKHVYPYDIVTYERHLRKSGSNRSYLDL